ncbi:hypothetical protein FIBSPDRAFT_119490 [Athelia psychrophila]|uniref:Uncharacterized protein n=1 Tax=Athelia psychrophila TaxID=1759441 RepID=A0A166CU69_9AGAM|nr:hypothetical protein FIBSPDRAFT_119490 [Fibularhizoctonia sp. CBS 109695]
MLCCDPHFTPYPLLSLFSLSMLPFGADVQSQTYHSLFSNADLPVCCVAFSSIFWWDKGRKKVTAMCPSEPFCTAHRDVRSWPTCNPSVG